MAEIDIIVEDRGWTSAMPDPEGVARTAAAAVLTHAFGPGQDKVELAIVLADDRAVRELNRRFRAKDAPTNVLSFPAGVPPPAHGPIGDVILARETCCREAGEQGKALDHHTAHLIVHGVLHLLGRDHAEDAEALQMEAEECAILAGLGMPDPYRSEAAPDPERDQPA